MNSALKKKKKKFNRGKQFGLKKQILNFKYCFDGVLYALTNEQSMISHFIIAIITIILGFVVKLSKIEWFFVILLIALVIAIEFINTSIEAVCDMVMPDIHPLAKIAKDTSSAAVLAVSLAALIIGLIIYVPKFLALF